MSSDDIAIVVTDVSKYYLMFRQPQDRLKQMVLPKLQRLSLMSPRQYYHDFRALEGVSFEVRRGETVGIIGRNGSGKSTLLQLICGTLQPSTGSISVNGRIAALLELGAGFNPEFTGRENVYLNAAILGAPRNEIDERFENIARFADIGEFIDQPVKTYSSGMYIRLAFAVAINVDPDILIIDEALSVGDEAFQRKCFARIEQIQERGGTILFVSHSAGSIIQLCNRAIMLDRGEVIMEGAPKTVVHQYQRFINLPAEAAELARDKLKNMDAWTETTEPEESESNSDVTELEESPLSYESQEDESWFDPNLISDSHVEYDNQGAKIHSAKIQTLDGRQVNNLKLGQTYVLSYIVDFYENIDRCVFGMQVKTIKGYILAGANNMSSESVERPNITAGTSISVEIKFLCGFLPDSYSLDVGIYGEQHGEAGFAHRHLDALLFKVMTEQNRLSVGHFDVKPEISMTYVQ